MAGGVVTGVDVPAAATRAFPPPFFLSFFLSFSVASPRPSSQGVTAERMSELSGHFLHPVPSPPSFTYASAPPSQPPDTFPQRNTHQQAIDTYSAEGREELWQWRHHTLQGGQGQ